MLEPQRVAESERQTTELDLDLLIRWQRLARPRRGASSATYGLTGGDDGVHETGGDGSDVSGVG